MANSYLDQDDAYLDNYQPRRKDNSVATLPTTYAQAPVNASQVNNSFATPADNQFAQGPARQPNLDNSQYIQQIANPAPAAPLTANQLGRNVGSTIGGGIASGWNQANDVFQRNTFDPAFGALHNTANFASGLFGGGNVDLPSFTGDQQPAQTNAAPTPPAPGEAYRGPMARTPNNTNWGGAGVNYDPMSNGVAAPAVANNVANFNDVSANGVSNANRITNSAGQVQPYGRMVNGIATFSDGSIPGTPRTMTADDMQNLIRSSAAPSQPYLGPEGGVLSAAGVNSPQQGVTFAALNRLPQGYDNSYDPSEAQSRARSDIADIINRDPRSTLGTAAWNASVDLSHARRNTRYGSSPSAYEGAVGALINQVNENLTSANQGALQGQRLNNQLGIAGLNNDARIGAANARADALQYGADARAGASRDVAQTNADSRTGVAQINADRPRIDATTNKAIAQIRNDNTKTPEEQDQQIARYKNDINGLGQGQSAATNGNYKPVGRDKATGRMVYEDDKGNRYF